MFSDLSLSNLSKYYSVNLVMSYKRTNSSLTCALVILVTFNLVILVIISVCR